MSQSRRGLCFSHVAKRSRDDLETERHYRGTVDSYCLFEIVPFRQLIAFFRPRLLRHLWSEAFSDCQSGDTFSQCAEEEVGKI